MAAHPCDGVEFCAILVDRPKKKLMAIKGGLHPALPIHQLRLVHQDSSMVHGHREEESVRKGSRDPDATKIEIAEM